MGARHKLLRVPISEWGYSPYSGTVALLTQTTVLLATLLPHTMSSTNLTILRT